MHELCPPNFLTMNEAFRWTNVIRKRHSNIDFLQKQMTSLYVYVYTSYSFFLDSSSKVDCKDIYDTKQCAAWQKTGECTKNPKWMNINCQKSCNKCPGEPNICIFLIFEISGVEIKKLSLEMNRMVDVEYPCWFSHKCDVFYILY